MIKRSSVFGGDEPISIPVTKVESSKDSKLIYDYSVRNSLDNLIELIALREMSTNGTRVTFGNQIKDDVRYVYLGVDHPSCGLLCKDTVIKIHPKNYGDLLLGVDTNSVVFLRLNHDKRGTAQYIHLDIGSISDELFARLDTVDNMIGENPANLNQYVSFNKVHISSISGGNSILLFHEKYAEDGYLVKLSCLGKDKFLTAKVRLDGDRLVEEKSIEFTYFSNDYFIDIHTAVNLSLRNL